MKPLAFLPISKYIPGQVLILLKQMLRNQFIFCVSPFHDLLGWEFIGRERRAKEVSSCCTTWLTFLVHKQNDSIETCIYNETSIKQLHLSFRTLKMTPKDDDKETRSKTQGSIDKHCHCFWTLP